MLAKGDYKYVHYVDHDPQLFDLDSDPDECENLAADPEYADVRAALESELRGLLDPEAVDAEAKADQQRRRDGPADAGD